MDIFMPGRDGLETTREIRQFEAARPTPKRTLIVAWTAEKTDTLKQDCFDAGFDWVFTKPPNWQEVNDYLDRELGARSSNSPIRSRTQEKKPAFDPGVVEAHFGGNRQLFEQFASWLDEPCTLEDLTQMTLCGDWGDAAKYVAHELRGRLKYFGTAHSAYRIAEELCEAIKGQDPERASELCSALPKAIAELRKEVQRFLQELST